MKICDYMIGKPKFKIDDIVQFDYTYKDITYHLIGRIEIVDAYGTVDQNRDVSYDVVVEQTPFFNNEKAILKHIIESRLNAI